MLALLVFASAAALADEIVETTDGRRLLLREDGRYEVLMPEPAPEAERASSGPLTLTDALAAPASLIGQTVVLDVTLRLFGGRALAVSEEAPGQALPVDLTRLDDRSAIIRACSDIRGCAARLSGVLRRNANGPFVDARGVELAE